MAQRFELMASVKAADPSTPDAVLAQQASEQFGRPIQQQTIAEYRKQFGIASVRKPSPTSLALYVSILKAALVSHGIEVPAASWCVTAVRP
jgi:hypothetical protein